ncbi:Sec-independent protein translocase protein TatB [Azospirillum sp. INR13]|uniref:Sec-independent protein translocase protein TatB n=1 Tax=Azospirillum sp. INR13 TaxID=2596919 RepID=UPI002104A04E|nr:Sec-independent protein translocase protein TatB [Azospirillum sp. INR13]
MFDIAWSELMVIAVIALVVIGPKDLPKAIFTLGKWVRKARGVAREFQTHIDDMMRETELDELRKEALKTPRPEHKEDDGGHHRPEGEVGKASIPKGFDVGLNGHAGQQPRNRTCPRCRRSPRSGRQRGALAAPSPITTQPHPVQSAPVAAGHSTGSPAGRSGLRHVHR